MSPASGAGGREDAYVSLGTNLGDRAEHLRSALRALARLPHSELAAVSPVYETAPVGPPPQGPYLNAVVRLRTALAPRALLDALLAIEAERGRVRSERRWEARTLDLDLLLHGARLLREPGLEVPHPRLAERAFVLEPLRHLAPDLVHPVLGESIAALAARAPGRGDVRPWSGDDEAFRAGLRL